MRVGKWVTREMEAAEYGPDGEDPLVHVQRGEGLVHDPGFHQAQLHQYQFTVLQHQLVVSFHKFDYLDNAPKMVDLYEEFKKCPACLSMEGTDPRTQRQVPTEL